jgi:hypothetical protein
MKDSRLVLSPASHWRPPECEGTRVHDDPFCRIESYYRLLGSQSSLGSRFCRVPIGLSFQQLEPLEFAGSKISTEIAGKRSRLARH